MIQLIKIFNFNVPDHSEPDRRPSRHGRVGGQAEEGLDQHLRQGLP